MRKNIIIGIIIVILGVGAYFIWAGSRKAGPASGGGASGGNSEQAFLYSMGVEKPNLVVHGKSLGRVEIWAIPAGTKITEKDYTQLGMATKDGNDTDGTERWLFRIPDKPVLATEIFAKVYDKGNGLIGTVSLPARGATALRNLLWGSTQ